VREKKNDYYGVEEQLLQIDGTSFTADDESLGRYKASCLIFKQDEAVPAHVSPSYDLKCDLHFHMSAKAVKHK
jgi:hypothetical protein